MSEIIGHQSVLNFFNQIKTAGQLNHAYCFVGPEQVGKKTVAREIAAQLLNTDREKLARQPSYILVEQLFDEKAGKTKKDIIVEQIRDLRWSLTQRAAGGGYKIAIIDNAHQLNSAAANALLKTLEEPADKTILFLITQDERQLPETIISRCQTIYFFPVSRSEIQNYLAGRLPAEEAEEMSRLAQGLPGLAMSWLAERAEFDWQKKEAARFASLLGVSFYKKLQAVEDLFGKDDDHIAGRDKLQKTLSLWQILIRDMFLQQLGLTDLNIHRLDKVTAWPASRIGRLEQDLQAARQMLAQNIHPRLLIENILLNLP